ncbi:hypothetical protein [Methanobrevibacter millerae]|uniref:hypothetical protein n=1 Tax=Methanobrevibacter millerae TaxID=230361 RepID=UPI0026EB0269|nr:hypothetical protein [Methanobrevibacter millerae]
MKIGRFAVNKKYRSSGLGTILLDIFATKLKKYLKFMAYDSLQLMHIVMCENFTIKMNLNILK